MTLQGAPDWWTHRTPCPRCGTVHDRAACHTSKGKPCAKWPVRGGWVCTVHGGSAPQVRAGSARRVDRARVETQLVALLDELELEYDKSSPLESLIEAVSRTRSTATAARQMLDIKDPATLELYGYWVTKQAETARHALAANVDERQQQLRELEAQDVATVLVRLLEHVEVLVADWVPAGEVEGFRVALRAAMRAAITDLHPTAVAGAVEVEGREGEA